MKYGLTTKRKFLYSATLFAAALCFALTANTQNSKTQTSQTKPVKLPAVYVEDRFYVQPVMLDGTKLNFFTDTGGGIFVFAAVAENLKLVKTSVKGDDGKTFETVSLPAFKPDATIPEPLGTNGRLYVVPALEKSAIFDDWTGMLGQTWFAGRVWTFDYLKKQLLLRASGDLPKHSVEHRVKLGFPTNKAGKRAANYPRIGVIIDGEPIDLLFDTGASTELSASALSALKDNRPAVRGTSFIVASVFEKWRKKHSDWRVIEKSNLSGSEAMIEVPRITVAGFTVGTVWFTRKPDPNFHVYMSQFMDKRIEGALGGSALKYFRVSVDYPNAVAVFER
jgi:hypothetical protein